MSALMFAMRISKVSFEAPPPLMPSPPKSPAPLAGTFNLPPPPGTTMSPLKLGALKSGISKLKEPPLTAPTLISGTLKSISGIGTATASCTEKQLASATPNFALAATSASVSAGQMSCPPPCPVSPPSCCFDWPSAFFFSHSTASCCILVSALRSSSNLVLWSLISATHCPSWPCKSYNSLIFPKHMDFIISISLRMSASLFLHLLASPTLMVPQGGTGPKSRSPKAMRQ
mmetsp:Transcript_70285/g.131455  ORF Transcript_70285/g.131455 Transcript_70285/m.131455 type:complete len:230 (-) Transcript_70285:162-851(-)